MKKIYLTEEEIQDMSTEKSFERGGDLYQFGAIYTTYRRGNTIYGKCEGSKNKVYDLEVDFANDEVDPFCSCPYDWGGLCKHLVAFLLTYVFEEERFFEPVDIPTLLEPLDREDLIILIAKLIKENPDKEFWLQKYIKENLK